MSNINVIGVIGALFIAATLSMHHFIITFNRMNIGITSGVAQGAPMLPAMRWRTLMLVQVPVVAVAGSFALMMAFAFWTIGDNVDDADVSLLAQACAWLYVCLAALLLVAAPVAIAGIASLLRKRERD